MIQETPVRETPVLARGTFNPWKTMWLRPRATIRALVAHDPTKDVDRLAILMGITQVIEQNSVVDGTFQSVLVLLAIAAVVGPIGGLIGIRISGAVSGWIGRKLGGTATNDEVRAAYAWSAVPRITALPLQLFFLLILPFFSANPAIGSLLVVLGVVLIVLGVWELVLTVATLAEVHRFSIGRAIGTLVLPFVVIGGIALLCSLPALLAVTR
jgi:hypothetical protein